MAGWLVPVVLVLAAGQPPETPAEAPVEAVCLSNACAPRPRTLTEPGTVRQAVEAGNARAVRDLGGAPADAVAALVTRIDAKIASGEIPAGSQEAGHLRGFMAGFGQLSPGDSLSFGDANGIGNPNGPAVVGAIVRRSADGSTSRVFLLEDGGAMITGVGPPPELR